MRVFSPCFAGPGVFLSFCHHDEAKECVRSVTFNFKKLAEFSTGCSLFRVYEMPKLFATSVIMASFC